MDDTSSHILTPVAYHRTLPSSRDSSLGLSESVCRVFAQHVNPQSNEAASCLWTPDRLALLARCISNDTVFPFTARMHDKTLVLTPAVKRKDAVVKDLSLGVTSVYKQFMRDAAAPASLQLTLIMLFLHALLKSYEAAGLDDGPQTVYTTRSC